jgi:hypothetical protein
LDRLNFCENDSLSALPSRLTREEFDRQYGHEAGWEYWFGKAVRKPVPDWMHGLLQALLCELLYRAGYKAASEVDLRARPDWRPRPDVSAVLKMEGRYPSQLDVAVEILSDDQASYIRDKCVHYLGIGIPQIFVFDGKLRTIQGVESGDSIS